MIELPKPIVDAQWLFDNLNDPNLIVLEATIPRVTANKTASELPSGYIPNSIFFDIKNEFSDANAEFPNTMLAASEFEKRVQGLGVNKTNHIVVYDNHGIYSSPRVWFMFKSMGFDNVSVLNGGLPKWIEMNYPVEKERKQISDKGNFQSTQVAEKFVNSEFVLNQIKNLNSLVIDARSEGRFNSTSPEPREGVRSGHIPNSQNIPYSSLLNGVVFKSKEELIEIFNSTNTFNKKMIFSCGTGITACVLALAAEIAGYENYSVYDGSWTEWGSSLHLPIET